MPYAIITAALNPGTSMVPSPSDVPSAMTAAPTASSTGAMNTAMTASTDSAMNTATTSTGNTGSGASSAQSAATSSTENAGIPQGTGYAWAMGGAAAVAALAAL